MKRIVLLICLIAASNMLAAAGKSRWEARLDMGGLFPADSGYRAAYGNVAWLPRVEFACRLSKCLGAWAGFSMLSSQGAGPLTGIPAESSQQHLACGLFYTLAMSERTSLRLTAGPMLSFYREEAGNWKASGSRVGIDASVAIVRSLSNAVAVEGRLGYLGASGKSEFGEAFTLGGGWIGAGIVFHF